MYRSFEETLKQWEQAGAKKPLLVIGARQTGKTYCIQKYLKATGKDIFSINLERQNEYLSIFEGDLTPEVLLKRFEQLSARRVTKDTVIFIDEIQQSERAITSLKYFCEAGEKYRVIAAGSLLGVRLPGLHPPSPWARSRYAICIP